MEGSPGREALLVSRKQMLHIFSPFIFFISDFEAGNVVMNNYYSCQTNVNVFYK